MVYHGLYVQYAVFPADGRFVLQSPIVFLVPSVKDQPSVTVLSQLLTRGPGTSCQKMLHLPSLNTPFAASSKRGFSGHHSDTDCILTFRLICSNFETVLPFKVYDMISLI